MWEFRCGRFPTGTARIRTRSGQVVLFVDGRATVDDADLAAELREVPAVYRVVQLSGPDVGGEPDHPSPAPKRRATRTRRTTKG